MNKSRRRESTGNFVPIKILLTKQAVALLDKNKVELTVCRMMKKSARFSYGKSLKLYRDDHHFTFKGVVEMYNEFQALSWGMVIEKMIGDGRQPSCMNDIDDELGECWFFPPGTDEDKDKKMTAEEWSKILGRKLDVPSWIDLFHANDTYKGYRQKKRETGK